MISWSVVLREPCGRMDCPSGWTRTRENSLLLRDAELWFVWKGRGWMRTADRELVLRPGFCALMRPGGIYDAGHDEAEKLGIVFLHFDVLRAGRPVGRDFFRAWPEFFEVTDVAYWDAVTRRLVQLARRDPAAAAMLLRAVLADLLGSPGPGAERVAGGSAERRISEIAAHLASDAAEPPAVPELARRAGMSPGHFTRSFRRVTGLSPKEFLVRTRLSRARHLLRETSLGISEIADRLGYADVFFFSRQFRQKTGVSPSAYRRGE